MSVKKEQHVLGSCHECFRPVVYGTPVYWTICNCCNKEAFAHQTCIELAGDRLLKELEEEGQPVLGPVIN
jgi:hypothetical protein